MIEGDIDFYGNGDAMMLAAYLFLRKKEAKKVLLCLMKEYFLGLPGALQNLRHQKLYCLSLLIPYLSPWQKVYFSGHDPSMITIIGFHNKSFVWLFQKFQDMYYTHTALGVWEVTALAHHQGRGRCTTLPSIKGEL
eukprot:8218914-Ditylum_brightwellii.AAC.1